MQGVNVYENGIRFLYRCLSLYMSGTGFFILYLLALAFIAIRGERRDREIFIPQSVILLITVLNPLFPLVLDKIFDVNSEYYRFFWLAPVVILVPYAATRLICGAKDGRGLTIVLICAAFILGGNFAYGEGIKVAENIYKVPDELIGICDMIHEDASGRYPKAFFEYEYNMEVRQYDPKILLCVDREDYLYAVNYSYTDEMLADPEKPVYKILALMVRGQKVDGSDFTAALEDTGTEYVVVTKGHPAEDYLKKAGLGEVGSTDRHRIYKYGLKEDPAYELVDYTGAEHRFSYRRLK